MGHVKRYKVREGVLRQEIDKERTWTEIDISLSDVSRGYMY